MTSPISSSSITQYPLHNKAGFTDEDEKKYFVILKRTNLKNLLVNYKLKKFVAELYPLNLPLQHISLRKIFDSIQFKHTDKKTAFSFLKGLFSPDSKGMSKAFLALMDAKNTPEQDNLLVWFIRELCLEFNKFYPTDLSKNPLLSSHEDNLDYCLSACDKGSTSKEHKEYYQQRAQTHIILDWIKTFYNVDENTREVQIKNGDDIFPTLNEFQNKLKGTLNVTKGALALNAQQSWSGKENIALGVAYNASTNTGPFSNAVTEASSPATSTQNLEIAGYNSGVSLFAALMSSIWRSSARNPKEADRRAEIVRIKSLYKFSKILSNPDTSSSVSYKFSSAFLSRIERHHENLERNCVFKFVVKIRRRYFLSEKTKINIKNGGTYANKNLPSKNAELKLYETHYDRATEVKTAFFHFKTALSSNLKTNSSLAEIVNKFIESMLSFQVKLGEKYLNELTFKQNKFRGTLFQHVMNLYKIYPSARNELIKIIDKLLLRNEKTLSDVLTENKKVIAGTDWKLRNDACLSFQTVLLNILGSNLTKSEQTILIQSILELLQAKDKGPMAALRERREKRQIDARSALVLQGWNLKRVVPLVAASSLTMSADTAALGWGINAAFIPLVNYFSTCDTATFKSMEDSLQGALAYLKAKETNNSDTLENDITSIHSVLNKEKNAQSIYNFVLNKKEISSESAQVILGTLAALKTTKGSPSLCLALEYNHGRKESKFPLLFELMDKLPQSYIAKLFKIYFTKEDLNRALSKPENSEYNRDLFNQFLSQEIKTAKSPREAAFITIKGMAYLHHFHEDIENKEKIIAAEKNEALEEELNEQKQVYESCRQKLQDVMENAYDDKYSGFRVLSKQSRGSRFRSEFAIRAVGASFWGLMAASLTSTILGLTNLGIGVGIGISMTGIGLPLGIPLLLIFAAVRMVLYAFSDDPDRQHSRKTATYRRVKNHATQLPQFEHLSSSNKKRFVGKLENVNSTTPSQLQKASLSHLLEEQTKSLFGFDVDKKNIEAINRSSEFIDIRLVEYKRIKEELLLQNYEKSSLLEVLFRIVRLVVVCDLKLEFKIAELEALFKDIQAGRNGDHSSIFSRLSLENSYTRTKNWFVFHAALGMGTGVGTITGLFFGGDALEALIQLSLTTAGDVVCGQSQNQRLYSPRGNTKSFQHACLLIQNMLAALAVENKGKLPKASQEILNRKISRLNVRERWNPYGKKTKATPIFKMA